MIDPINKAGNVFEGGALLVAQADPKCWVREGYTVVKSIELEQLRAELEQAQNEIGKLRDNQLKMADDYNKLINVRVCLQSEIYDLKIENKLQALEYITLAGEMQTLLERGEV